MAPPERYQSGDARGIARFLSDHQHCEGGFDVHRGAGPGEGPPMVTCKGCGRSIGYRVPAAGVPWARPSMHDGAPVPEEAATRAEPFGEVAAAQPPSHSGAGRRRRWLAPVLIGALIIAGLVMIALGVNRSTGDPGSSAPATTTSAEATTPAETIAPATSTPIE